MVPGAKVLSNLAGCRAYNERWDREKVFYGRRDQRELSGGYRLNGIRIPYIPPRGQGQSQAFSSAHDVIDLDTWR